MTIKEWLTLSLKVLIKNSEKMIIPEQWNLFELKGKNEIFFVYFNVLVFFKSLGYLFYTQK